MGSLNNVHNNYKETAEFEIRREKSSLIKVVSIVAAVAVTIALLGVFLLWRKSHEEKVGADQLSKAVEERPALPVKVQIFLDEPIRKGSQVIIGGTVRNVSNESLSNLSVDLELAHKKDGSAETHTLDIKPEVLGPAQEGRYTRTLTGDYSSLKLLRIKSGPQALEIGYKTAPGAKRPLERPSQTTKTIIVNRPRIIKDGEEFINTPDDPAKIP